LPAPIETAHGRTVDGSRVGEYREIGGLRLPTRGGTVYARPDGPFTYGEFTLRSIAFDLPEPTR
jgi:hypothetical protein